MYIIINFIGSSLAVGWKKLICKTVLSSAEIRNIAHWQQHVMLNIVIWRPKWGVLYNSWGASNKNRPYKNTHIQPASMWCLAAFISENTFKSRKWVFRGYRRPSRLLWNDLIIQLCTWIRLNENRTCALQSACVICVTGAFQLHNSRTKFWIKKKIHSGNGDSDGRHTMEISRNPLPNLARKILFNFCVENAQQCWLITC